jgi:SAM-dependent methyltransferase
VITKSEPQVDVQYAVNASVYHASNVHRYYYSDHLWKTEVKVLLKYHAAFAGKDVLDVGVGTGRTTIYLAPLAGRYEGMDYSPVMVERAAAASPGAKIRLADMRNLSDYGSKGFDFVFATNNVIDAVSHADRLQTLSEFRRVLREGGILVFSSHNLKYRDAFRGPQLEYSRDPFSQAALLKRHYRRWKNHLRLRKLHRVEERYALLTDTGHDYACLHYYIDRFEQEAQLTAAGFDLLEVFDTDGGSLAKDDVGAPNQWLMYVARAASTGAK